MQTKQIKETVVFNDIFGFLKAVTLNQDRDKKAVILTV